MMYALVMAVGFMLGTAMTLGTLWLVYFIAKKLGLIVEGDEPAVEHPRPIRSAR